MFDDLIKQEYNPDEEKNDRGMLDNESDCSSR